MSDTRKPWEIPTEYNEPEEPEDREGGGDFEELDDEEIMEDIESAKADGLLEDQDEEWSADDVVGINDDPQGFDEFALED